jgi:hypothetical protein
MCGRDAYVEVYQAAVRLQTQRSVRAMRFELHAHFLASYDPPVKIRSITTCCTGRLNRSAMGVRRSSSRHTPVRGRAVGGALPSASRSAPSPADISAWLRFMLPRELLSKRR